MPTPQWKVLAICAVITSVLSSCLEDETRCSYFRLTEKEIYNNTWKADAFHVHISDSAANYIRDTTYLNAGTVKFIPDDPYKCNFIGKMVFSRSNGSIENIAYKIELEYFETNISFNTASSFDGYPGAANEYGCINIASDTILIGEYYNFSCGSMYSLSPGRYWTLKLSKQ